MRLAQHEDKQNKRDKDKDKEKDKKSIVLLAALYKAKKEE